MINLSGMKTDSNNRWMVWAIIVLAIMNITTLVTVIYHRYHIGETINVPVPDKVQSESASIKYSGRYFRDQLGLNKEQMIKFAEFNPVFRQGVRTINFELAEKRHRMLIGMAEKNCDTNRLNTLSDSIGYLHASLKKLTYMYYLNFKNICNKQQQEKLEKLFGEMFTSDVQMGQNGNGGPNGRRYGKRFNN